MTTLQLEPLHQCRRCGGYIHREHYHEIRAPNTDFGCVLEYCDHCALGWVTTCDVVGEELRPRLPSQRYDPKVNPVAFGKFLQRLERYTEEFVA